jgi:hypothetical protein
MGREITVQALRQRPPFASTLSHTQSFIPLRRVHRYGKYVIFNRKRCKGYPKSCSYKFVFRIIIVPFFSLMCFFGQSKCFTQVTLWIASIKLLYGTIKRVEREREREREGERGEWEERKRVNLMAATSRCEAN